MIPSVMVSPRQTPRLRPFSLHLFHHRILLPPLLPPPLLPPPVHCPHHRLCQTIPQSHPRISPSPPPPSLPLHLLLLLHLLCMAFCHRHPLWRTSLPPRACHRKTAPVSPRRPRTHFRNLSLAPRRHLSFIPHRLHYGSASIKTAPLPFHRRRFFNRLLSIWSPLSNVKRFPLQRRHPTPSAPPSRRRRPPPPNTAPPSLPLSIRCLLTSTITPP